MDPRRGSNGNGYLFGTSLDLALVPMPMEPPMDTFCNILGSIDPGVVPMPMEPQMDKFWKLFGSMHERIHYRYIQIFSLGE